MEEERLLIFPLLCVFNSMLRCSKAENFENSNTEVDPALEDLVNYIIICIYLYYVFS